MAWAAVIYQVLSFAGHSVVQIANAYGAGCVVYTSINAIVSVGASEFPPEAVAAGSADLAGVGVAADFAVDPNAAS